MGADRTVDDLAPTDVRLFGVYAQDRSDVCVKIDAQLLPGGYAVKVTGW